MVINRETGLKRNFRLMFWIQALTEVKVINVISTIFYIHRGLTLSQIFYLTIAFALVSLITEVPSSYFADKWSRKGLIITSLFISVAYWTLNLTASGFPFFLVVISLYALSYSVMSGTDEALIYDSAKELGEESKSLRKLGIFYSSQRIFKIVTPLVAVLLANSLTEWQFRIIISIDIFANCLALLLALKLIEPKHQFQVEKVESGVMFDAIKLLKNNSNLLNIIVNRSLIFIAGLAVWRISSEYFKDIGAPIFFIGLATATNQLIIFLFNINANRWFKNVSSHQFINRLNFINLLALSAFILNQVYLHHWFFGLLTYCVILISETIRWPYFSDLFNKASQSYNRATTLSLSSFLNSLLQIPIFLFGSILVSLGFTHLFVLVFATVIAVNLFFRASEPLKC